MPQTDVDDTVKAYCDRFTPAPEARGLFGALGRGAAADAVAVLLQKALNEDRAVTAAEVATLVPIEPAQGYLLQFGEPLMLSRFTANPRAVDELARLCTARGQPATAQEIAERRLRLPEGAVA